MSTEATRTNGVIFITVIILFLGAANIGLVMWNRYGIDRNYKSISEKTADRWTKSDHRKWLEELRKANPGLNIP